MQLIKIFYKENVPILNDFWYKNLYALVSNSLAQTNMRPLTSIAMSTVTKSVTRSSKSGHKNTVVHPMKKVPVYNTILV